MEVPDYDLPERAIAQQPVEPRDAARLLDATDPDGTVGHRRVRDLPDLLGPGDVLVVNTSRVVPARLALVRPGGAPAEVLLLEPRAGGDGREWEALVRPSRRLAPGTVLRAPGAELRPPGPDPEDDDDADPDPEANPDADRPDAVLEIGDRLPEGRRAVRLLVDADTAMAAAGALALPPYIRVPLADPDRYQTVYARDPGSVAAPTAGLHLTDEVLDRCRARGVEVAGIDLAVGLATFRPISAERAEDHVMHEERYSVPAATLDACRRARRVVAVGTTVVRALESAAAGDAPTGRTDLFIRPGFRFGAVDVLMTNFHLPRSSLLLLLEAFCGPRWRALYGQALEAGYRFLSFGDAMIVGRAPDAGTDRGAG